VQTDIIVESALTGGKPNIVDNILTALDMAQGVRNENEKHDKENEKHDKIIKNIECKITEQKSILNSENYNKDGYFNIKEVKNSLNQIDNNQKQIDKQTECLEARFIDTLGLNETSTKDLRNQKQGIRKSTFWKTRK